MIYITNRLGTDLSIYLPNFVEYIPARTKSNLQFHGLSSLPAYYSNLVDCYVCYKLSLLTFWTPKP